MAPRSAKRKYSASEEDYDYYGIPSSKLQKPTVIRNDVAAPQRHLVNQMSAPPVHQHQAMYGTGVRGPTQLQAFSPDALWKTVATMDLNVLREHTFHATLGNMTLQQMTHRVLDDHSSRLRLEAEAIDNAHRAQLAKERRDRKQVFDFDSHFRQIDDWLSNDPIDRKACRTSYSIYEKIVARIEKITTKATEATTNFASKCNALDTLTRIVESMIDNKDGAMGCEIWFYMSHDGSMEESMLKVLRTMSSDERRSLLTVAFDGTWWVEKMKTLDVRSQTVFRPRIDRRPAFPKLSEVLTFVMGPRVKQEVIDEAPADVVQVKQEMKREVHVKQESHE